MDGFKKLPKVQCFKEGGYVTKKEFKNEEKRESKREEKKDVSEDKKLIKKAVGQHEAMKHKGQEKTELKLKSGGRAKKEKGTVKKYKAGGCATDKKESACTSEKKAAPKKMAVGGKTKSIPVGTKGPLATPKPDPTAALPKTINPLTRPKPDIDFDAAFNSGANTLMPQQAPQQMPQPQMSPTPMPNPGMGMGQAQPNAGMGQAMPAPQMQPGLPPAGISTGMPNMQSGNPLFAMQRMGGRNPMQRPGGVDPMGRTPSTNPMRRFKEGGSIASRLYENVMGTPEQNAEAKKSLDKVAKQDSMVGSMERAARKMQGQGAVTDKERETATKGLNNPMKRGGKACK